MNRLQAICYALFLVLALAFESDVSAGQKKKVEEMPQGTHVLWHVLDGVLLGLMARVLIRRWREVTSGDAAAPAAPPLQGTTGRRS